MITLLTLISYVLVASSQVLHLKPGKVQGFEHTTKNGTLAEVFLNIPYASPPVGQLRFEKPTPPVPWNNTRDGTKFGASCLPIIPEAALPPGQPSEDCLTLNIIRPKKEAPPSGFPILFWVHGGAFEVGSASLHGYKGFADIYIPSDIIVVTIQYRLGVYGFLSTGDSHIPGNLGLFDMAEALKFIHTNAENIGGDRSRITVWGHSAGSAAAGQLILSPVTRGVMKARPFFQRFFVNPADYPNWNRERLVNLLKKVVKKMHIGDHLEELLRDIVSYYVDRDEKQEHEFYIDRYTEFFSDLLFIVPSADGIFARRAAGWDMYAYVLDHYNEAIWNITVPKRLRGAPHGAEAQYTKGTTNLKKLDFNNEEQVVADVFRQSFIEFVKTGVPSNKHVSWLNVGTDKDLRYLQITPKPLMRLGFYNETTSFWHKTLKYGFNVVQLLPTEKSVKRDKLQL
ncbi:hypothetical protein Y032_0195g1473 [Ancylostoma ceylanicum]|uniref:Carboxylesterase type B domain-containing protein n=1 Tax=Ancylostoma ceylanicum TaxID=53326 RepID=A0A016SNN2_9BILA|nr:hypothetical protein Y032_0195g1473 [Ancylostoma ceylanicum]